jgi:disulfide oxidoreductase YuzD
MAKKKTDTVIANPIYDVVFKNLMTTNKVTNKDIASYFVGTVLGEEITDIDLLPQEYTYYTKSRRKIKAKKIKLIRLDFVATIHTKNGEYKKVLIEIQKSQKPTDLLRFRTYLGEQYKQLDTIKVKDDRIDQSLPIVVIYMLGFKLPEIERIVVKVNRTYIDVINGEEEKNKSPFIESLTHDGYFIQIPRINGEAYKDWDDCSELKQMLSLFQQDYFVDENFLKKYPYPITNNNVKKMVDTLNHIAADPKIRRKMQEERWAAQNESLWENELAAKDKKIAELEKILQQAGIAIPSV